MAQQLYFSRDSKMFIEFNSVVWEVPVLDGFSFSQATNSSEITLAEMESSGGVSRRGRRAFNDSLAPGEWSFSTYIRPFQSAGSAATGKYGDGKIHAVEEVLWALMMGANAYDSTAKDYENTLVINATEMVQGETYEIVTPGNTTFTGNVGAADSNAGTIFTRGSSAATGNGTVKRKVTAPATGTSRFSFHASNSSELGTANIYFVMGDANRKVMKLNGVTVNEASCDFDIDGIAQINWSGNANEVVDFTGSTIEKATQPVHTDSTQDAVGTIAIGDVWLESDASYKLYVLTNVSNGSEASTSYINEDLLETGNFIRNRLTQLTVEPTSQDPDGDGSNELEASYSLTLTGGNVTFSNNITYITPEELGIVNVPIGHVTGTRAVNGSLTCYLTEDTAATNASADFFEDLRSITNVVTNSFDLTFKIGGVTAGTPRLEINVPTCHVEVPTHSIEDVISLETNFMALPSSIDGTDEATLTYKA